MENFSLNTGYKVVRKIADGGMGSVFEAMQCGAVGFEKRVAVKQLLPQYAERNNFREMFIAEAKLVASLIHENIVQLYHLGEVNGCYLMVMEYIDGYSLDHFIQTHKKKGKSVPMQLAVFIASRIARGLAYAHARPGGLFEQISVVHRDVSPKNILVTSEGLPKLADFGLALIVEDGNSAKQDIKAGKLAYMPPEQARGNPLDSRTDVFSLGAVLFELLSLLPIRSAENQFHQLKQAIDGEVRWERLEQLKLPTELISILQRCLNSDVDKRYDNTAELARDLEMFIYKDGYGPTIATLKEYAGGALT